MPKPDAIVYLNSLLTSGLSEAEYAQVMRQLTILNWDSVVEANGIGSDTNDLLNLSTAIATCNATEVVLDEAMTDFQAQKASALAQIEAGWAQLREAEQTCQIIVPIKLDSLISCQKKIGLPIGALKSVE